MWFYKEKVVNELIDGFESFVYLIERLNIDEEPNKPIYYIGKKNFYSRRKINGKRTIVEQDWKSYYGSSENLTNDVNLYGKDSFKRTILHFCRTKGDSGYLETFELMKHNVLHISSSGYKLYYNLNINKTYRSSPNLYDLTDIHNLNKTTFKDSLHKNKIWINNNKQSRLLIKREADKLLGSKEWTYGRVSPSKTLDSSYIVTPERIINSYSTLINIYKDNQYIFINKNELEDYIKLGWTLNYSSSQFIANNGIKELTFFSEEELLKQIKLDYWNEGTINNNIKLIPAINLKNNELIAIPIEEFESNPYLVRPNTKKVRIKKRNRIIFEGFIDLFFLDNPLIPIQPFNRTLNKKESKVIVTRGKYKYLTNEKYDIKYI